MKRFAPALVIVVLSAGVGLIAPSAVWARAHMPSATKRTLTVPTFRLVRLHGKLEVQHGTRKIHLRRAVVVHTVHCTLTAYTPSNGGNWYTTQGWQAKANWTCDLENYGYDTSQAQVCMAQLVTGGWKTINVYNGQDACEKTPVANWGSVTMWSAKIDLTLNRWYSTWAWGWDANTGEQVVAEPADTPGVCVKVGGGRC
jgi:hypothetical protein